MPVTIQGQTIEESSAEQTGKRELHYSLPAIWGT